MMGLLSSLVSKVKTSVVGKALDTLSAAFIKPVETVKAIISPTKTVADVVKQVEKQSLTKNITSTVLNTATAAAAVVGVGAISAASKAGTLATSAASVAKSLIPSTAKGKVIAAVAAPVIVGAIAKEPVKAIKAAVSAPTELAKFGGDVATFAANPSIETAKQVIKESPVISAIVGTAAIGTAIATVAPAVSAYLQREVVKEQTEVLKEAITAIPQSSSGVVYAADVQPISPSVPITPETKAITSGSAIKKRRKAKVKEKPLNVSQRVNVIVSNQNILRNKRYLNKELLLN